MSTIYEYNDFNGEEERDKEYKLFTFHPNGLNFDTEDTEFAEHLFFSGEWMFNDSVLDNLNYYLETYIPKYTTAFLNKLSESKNGEMFFGISDDGFIQGIPYKGKLDINVIKDKTFEIISSNKIETDYDISSCIDVELIQVDTSNFVYDNQLLELFDLYNKEKKEYRKLMMEYKIEKKYWFSKVKYYNRKLHIMMNHPETRNELIEYIEKNDPSQTKVIKILKGDYKFEDIHGEEVAKYKLSSDNPWYWVCKWKDERVEEIKQLKPKSPGVWSNQYLPINTITTIIDMIPLWLEKSNINLYLIKFTFTKPKNPLDIYYRSSSGEFISCYRGTFLNEPSCLPY